MRFALVLIAYFIAFPVVAQEVIIAEESEELVDAPPEAPKEYSGLRFRGLNKITTRTEEFTSEMGKAITFGSLEIIPRACWTAPANQRPEQAGLLEIVNREPNQQPERLFFGWMFATSPGISSLEHPLYDITMLECILKNPVKETSPPSDELQIEPEIQSDSPIDDGVRILED